MKFTFLLSLPLNLLALRVLFIGHLLQAQDSASSKTLSVAVDSGDTSHYRILGYSTNQYPIECYRFGKGQKHIALIGGIHGGYEWNTIMLAYAMIDHFSQKPQDVPDSLTLHIIACANPDGLAAVIGRSGRFSAKDIPKNTESGRVNGNSVDLNRNWDCYWDSLAIWRKKKVSGGSEPFSEIETRILKTYLTQSDMQCVVFFHSQYPGIFPGGCDRIDSQTMKLAQCYSKASGYRLYAKFPDYPVTGSAADWLAGQGVPAITVELSNHHQTEFGRNRVAVIALLRLLSNP